jgi:hypothetical protein
MNGAGEDIGFAAGRNGFANGLKYRFGFSQIRVCNGPLVESLRKNCPVAAHEAERVRVQPDSLLDCFDRHTALKSVTRLNIRGSGKNGAREQTAAIVECFSYLAPTNLHFLGKDRQNPFRCKALIRKHDVLFFS